MNSNLLRAYIISNFGTQTAAAERWEMGKATLSRKINGTTDFTVRELKNIKRDCKISNGDFIKIFFS